MPKLKPDTLRCGDRDKAGDGLGAKNRAGEPCEQAAGFQTDHPGEGRCRWHGGMTPIKHGRYSKLKTRNRLRQLIDQHSEDPDPLNLDPELAATRAIFQDFLERFDEWQEMITTWHESYVGKFRAEMNQLTQLLRARDAEQLAAAIARIRDIIQQMPPKPNRVMDVLEVVKILRTISDLTDRITSVRERQQVPLSAVVDMQDKMAMVVLKELGDKLGPKESKVVAQRIARKWDEIQIQI